MKLRLASFLALLFTLPARADILFLDMNDNPKEIEAAQVAADKRKEKLVVYPKLLPAERKYRDDLTKRWTKAYESTQNCGDSCPVKQKEFEALDAELKQINEKFRFTPEGFSELIAKQAQSGKAFSSMVISGHDGTGSFNGKSGSVNGQDLANEFAKHPKLAGALQSLHLWGCYTTSPGSLLMNWKEYFPEVKLISGFDGSAPAGDKPANWKYLRAVLEKEAGLMAATDGNALAKMFRKMPGVNQTASAMCVGDEFVSRTESFNLKQMGDRCKKIMAEFELKRPIYQCYIIAQEKGCEDVPANTQSNELRDFYNLLQQGSACAQLPDFVSINSVNRDSLIRLILFRNVMKSFSRVHRKDIAELELILRSLGAPADLSFEGWDKLPRKAVLSQLSGIQSYVYAEAPLNDIPKGLKLNERLAKLSILNESINVIAPLLTNLYSHCVPFDWVENDPHAPRAPCISSDSKLEAVAELMKSDPKEGLPWKARDLFYTGIQTEMERVRAGLGKRASLAVGAAELNHLQALNTLIDSPGNEENQKVAKRAELVLQLAREGVKEPELDPRVQRLTFEIKALQWKDQNRKAEREIENQRERLTPELERDVPAVYRVRQRILSDAKNLLELNAKKLRLLEGKRVLLDQEKKSLGMQEYAALKEETRALEKEIGNQLYAESRWGVLNAEDNELMQGYPRSPETIKKRLLRKLFYRVDYELEVNANLDPMIRAPDFEMGSD